MMSADHQVRSLLDVISFILESLSTSEAQAFETDIFSDYFRTHFNLLEKKSRDIQNSCSFPMTKDLNGIGNPDDKGTTEKGNALKSPLSDILSQSPLHPSLIDEAVPLSNDKPMIIAENSLNEKFFEQQDDQTESLDCLPPSALFEGKDKGSKDSPLMGKIIIFDPFADNKDFDEYETEENDDSDEVRIFHDDENRLVTIDNEIKEEEV